MSSTKSVFFRVSQRAFPRRVLTALVVMCALAAHPSQGVAESSVLRELKCDGCHRVEVPTSETDTIAAYAQRQAPDLFYAGNKYHSDWLRSWLVAPTVIRPAGYHPGDHTKTTESGDVVVSGQIAPHASVPPDRVDSVVEALMLLDAGQDRLPGEAVVPAKAPRMLLELNFTKFKGCGSCHRTSKNAPPASGPDLDDAYLRLTPEFLTSYLSNPQAWEPHAPMPGYALEPAEVAKLIAYLRNLSEDSHDTKTR